MVSQVESPKLDATRQLTHVVEGLVQVFTCTQRSFFTNVMAQALRIAGQGAPVLVVQFLKGGINQGYDRPTQLGQNLDWIRANIPGCITTPDIDESDRQSLLNLWQHTQKMVMQGRYDLVVLDELSIAINFGLIPEAEVLSFLNKRPRHIDLILTGPDMPRSILEISDQITELRRSHQP
jgi:cob(I)alamin adenosyltransferase